MLKAYLLGQFHIEINSEPVEISSRPAQAFFSYLLLNPKIQHRREKLAGLFWPDASEENARRSLRQALWHIRRGMETSAHPIIIADDLSVALDLSDGDQVDALTLQSEYAPSQSIDDLIDCLSLYRGELLPGFYEDWIVLERERLQAVYEQKMNWLLERLAAEGLWRDVLTWGERWIAQGSTPEPAYRALMLAHHGLRNTAAVTTTYQRCSTALERELGISPSEETRQLYQRLLKEPPLPIQEVEPEPCEREDGYLSGDSQKEGDADHPPFKGLQSFEEDDAGIFFGREELTTRVVNRLSQLQTGIKLLAVVGPSGSGKSSLVRAGVIPRLKNPRPETDETAFAQRSDHWEIHLIIPAAHPLETLAASLTQESESVRAAAALIDDMLHDSRSLNLYLARRQLSSRGQKQAPCILLVVDQFEEIFTQCPDEDERRALIENLLTAAEGEHALVLLTLRADFYAQCAAYPKLRSALAASQEYIGPMSAVELRRSIEEPARVSGMAFESGLVDLILRDLGTTSSRGDEGERTVEPGALPLLSHAMLETWKRREACKMTLAGYAEAGGVHGAIARTAETIYSHLAPDEQRLARRIFLRLTQLGDDTDRGEYFPVDTRRRISLDELVSNQGDAEVTSRVLKILTDARLLTAGDGTIEVAHEALIREWPALRTWLSEDREGLRLHRRLTESAQGWQAMDCEPAELYRGARLAQAFEWASAHPGELSALEQDFLDASRLQEQQINADREAARQRELEAARSLAEVKTRSNRRLRWLAAGLGTVLIVALILGGFFLQQRILAQAQTELATSRELAASATSNLDIDPERSMLLALQALRTGYTQEAEIALHQAVQGSRLVSTLKTQGPWATRMVVSPDGQRLAVTTYGPQSQPVTEIWDLPSGKRLFILPGYLSADFWPDDRRLATFANNAITFWDARTGQPLSTIHLQEISSEAPLYGNLSPDWTMTAEAFNDGTTGLSRLDTGKRVLTLGKPGDPASNMVAFSPDGGRLLAVVNQTTQIWDIRSGQEVATLPSAGFGILAAAFSPRSDQIALGVGPVVKTADGSTGQAQLTFFGHTGFVQGIHFNDDATRLATAGADGQAILWDAATGQALLKLVGHTGALVDTAFIPGGNRLATSSLDGTVRIWDVSPAGGGEGASSFDPDGKWYSGIAFNPDGSRLAISGGSTAGEIIDSATGKALISFPGNSGAWQGSAAFSPDGMHLALTSGENDATIWDASRGTKLLSLSGHKDWIGSLAFSPNGNRLASIGFDGQAKMWDAASGKELYSVPASDKSLDTTQVIGIAFSPDGKHFVTAMGRTPRIWDTVTGKEVLALPAQGENVYAASFSPDGKRLAIGVSLGEGASIWDASSGKRLALLTGHQGSVQAVLFSQDGKQVITGSVDGTTRIWDAATGEEQLTLTHQAAQITGLALSSDGLRLAASSSDGTARIYLLRVNDLIQEATSRLTRWFTPEECLKYLHTATCPSKP